MCVHVFVVNKRDECGGLTGFLFCSSQFVAYIRNDIDETVPFSNVVELSVRKMFHGSSVAGKI